MGGVPNDRSQSDEEDMSKLVSFIALVKKVRIIEVYLRELEFKSKRPSTQLLNSRRST
jgi:hypothetical protein